MSSSSLMRDQPRQIYTSVRSPDNQPRVSPRGVRIIVVAGLLLVIIAVIIMAIAVLA